MTPRVKELQPGQKKPSTIEKYPRDVDCEQKNAIHGVETVGLQMLEYYITARFLGPVGSVFNQVFSILWGNGLCPKGTGETDAVLC